MAGRIEDPQNLQKRKVPTLIGSQLLLLLKLGSRLL